MSQRDLTVREVLVGARERIAQGWCQDVSAVDFSGEGCCSGSPDAHAWCLNGAIVAADATEAVDLACFAAMGFRNRGEAVGWNDEPERTQAEVLARIDVALATLPEGPSDAR